VEVRKYWSAGDIIPARQTGKSEETEEIGEIGEAEGYQKIFETLSLDLS